MKKLLPGLMALLIFGGPAVAVEEYQVTVLYDNTVYAPNTKADWGFACLIEGAEKTILFDTGTQPDIFWHNIEVLSIDVDAIDLVVITHEHGDHTGGLWTLLKKK